MVNKINHTEENKRKPGINYNALKAKYRKALPEENKRFKEVVIIPLEEELGEYSWKAFISEIVVKSRDKKKMVLFHEEAWWVSTHYLYRIKELLPGMEISITSKGEW